MQKLKVNELLQNNIFCTPIYFDKKKEWLEKLLKNTDPYILETKNKNLSDQKKDFGMVHHSSCLKQDINFKEFLKYINLVAYDILNSQNFNLENYVLATNDLWVQEFSSLGGGNHSSHTHWNGHVSGFYFLKCSEKTSYPIFHDPRSAKRMNLLPEKNSAELSYASQMFHLKPDPGTFIFFNSYLEHEFTVDHGVEPFRFIHFNIQALPKQLLNNNIIKI